MSDSPKSKTPDPRKADEPAADLTAAPAPAWARVGVPIFAVVVMGLWVASTAFRTPAVEVGAPDVVEAPAESGEFDVEAFGRLPVVYQGRTKPWDTVARNSLMIISKRQTFVEEFPVEGSEDVREVRQPAIKWLLDVIARRETAFRHKVFRIENDDVLDAMGLEARDGLRYAFEEFATPDNLARLDRDGNNARSKEAAQRTIYDAKVLELAEQVHLFHRLLAAHELVDLRSGQAVVAATQRYRDQLAEMALVHAVAPTSADGRWMPLLPATLIMSVTEPGPATANAASLYRILSAYMLGAADVFNSEVKTYANRLELIFGDELEKARAEVVFNRVAPFYDAAVIYGLVFGLVCLSLLVWGPTLRRTAFWLTVLAFVVHTAALVMRMYLQDRWGVFVTNLYSSAVFVGWGSVLVVLILERIFPIGIALIAGSVVGLATAIVAHGLSVDGDTLQMMQAVLDTNFWLATHVTSVTYGYAAVFLAGFLAILYILLGVFSTMLNRSWSDPGARLVRRAAGVTGRVATAGGRKEEPVGKIISRMVYGVLCFAMFLSFTGTVLGGIWADQSWGRFWGWDPKENGALMIVLWVALILHARWGGMIKARGIAVLAVLGNIIVAWSWFGTNMLGVGLHAYGFIDSALFWLLVFVASQLAIACLGLLPLSMWRSFKSDDGSAHAKPGATPLPA